MEPALSIHKVVIPTLTTFITVQMDIIVQLLLDHKLLQTFNTAIARFLFNSLISFSLKSSFPRYPGDDCMNNQECYTGHCVSGRCIVENNTNTCGSSSECGRGL